MKINASKEKITIVLTIFFICIVLVSVTFMQFKTVEKALETDIENMRETELREQISNYKTKYSQTAQKLEENNNKIQEYKEKVESNEAASELLEEELLQSNLLLGKTNVSGEGIVITLSDNQESIITAEDLRELINELKYAGAEAISINDIRIINLTDIVDVGNFILVKEQRLSSPFVIKAIGNQTYLFSNLSSKNGYVETYINNGKSVKLEKQRNIQILKYNGDIKMKYMKEVTEK